MSGVSGYDRLMVAVYWPNEGYGTARQCETEADALAHAERLQRLGYGDGKSEIHIIRDRRDVRVWSPEPPKITDARGRS
ncbi:MAG: hypothetical protein U1E40_10905 [Amaricoccus sp.]